MGRWKIEDPHKKHISVVLNDEEREAMEAAMKKRGVNSVSAFCRDCIMEEVWRSGERTRAIETLIAAVDRLDKKFPG